MKINLIFIVLVLNCLFKSSVCVNPKTVINLATEASRKIEKLLTSRCYVDQPDFKRIPTTWGYDIKKLLPRVQSMMKSDPEACPNLGVCPKLLPWMKQLKETNGAALKSEQNFIVEQQAKSYKNVPKPNDETPLRVEMTFYIESVSGFSEVNQEFGIGTFVRYQWNVTFEKCRTYVQALSYLNIAGIKDTDYKNLKGVFAPTYGFFVKLESMHYNLFWMPDIVMDNSKSVSRQLNTFKTNYLELRAIKREEDLKKSYCSFNYIERFAATVPCDMNFMYYPIDAQNCTLRFRSFEHAKDDVQIILGKNDLSNDVKKGLGDQYVNLTGYVNDGEMFGRNYSTASLHLRFQRTIISVLVGTIIPSLLIVIISFSSFWLGLDYLGDRINIGMICLLAILAQFTQARGNLPPTAYVTFMDYWMILCIFSIVGQLLQTTLVYFVYNYRKTKLIKEKDEEKKKEEKERTFFSRTVFDKKPSTSRYVGERLRRRRMSQPVYQDDDEDDGEIQESDTVKIAKVEQSTLAKNLIKFEKMLFEPPVKNTSTRYIPMKIDAVTRVLFPSSFITLVIVYWVILLSQKESKYYVF